MGFGPSLIPCHNCVDAVAYVSRKRSLKVMLLRGPKLTRTNTSDMCMFPLAGSKFIPECFGTVTVGPSTSMQRMTTTVFLHAFIQRMINMTAFSLWR
jgi:hypothetical protein